MVGSVSSKSEVALNPSTDDALDVSNSNTLAVIDPTNPVIVFTLAIAPGSQ
jgi:hypothetical protein